MRTIVAKAAGFCGGVRRAVALAERLAAANGGAPVFTDGPLIHNRGETERLAALGVLECGDPSALPPGSVLVVRAHGIPPARRAALEALPITLEDATCPRVLRIQERCRAEARDGRFVVVLGDRGHAEVVGLLGFAGPRSAVVSGPAEASALPDPGIPVSLVAQSTQSETLLAETAAALRLRFADVRVFDTICPATRERRAALEALAAECDAIAVVGSPHSANASRLLDMARAARPALLVENADSLDEGFFRRFVVVGVAAGASVPDSEAEAVRRRLERL